MLSGSYTVTSRTGNAALQPMLTAASAEQALRRRIMAELLRAMPTTGQSLSVDVDIPAHSVVLSGAVQTFHAKQVVLHSCRQFAMGMNVIDTVVVDDFVSPPCWRNTASSRR